MSLTPVYLSGISLSAHIVRPHRPHDQNISVALGILAETSAANKKAWKKELPRILRGLKKRT